MIYLDHAATTPLDPRVYEAMLPYMKDVWGNASSPHAKGREAREAIDTSRTTIANLIGVKPQEVIFVASGSEANTLAIFGICEEWMINKKKPGRLILLSTEHSCSLKAVEKLEKWGWSIVLLPVDSEGIMRMTDLENALTDDTALVSIQWANNEVGAIQPIEEIAELLKKKKIPFHVDAVQPMGHLPMPSPLPDMMSIAAHKFYGPKGIGALIVRDTIKLQPIVMGGGQEFGLRAGSENTPAIVGMAKALELSVEESEEESARLTKLRDYFIAEVLKIPGTALNGHTAKRLPNNVNIFFGRNAETLVVQLDMKGVCAATGAACVTGSSEPSHVIEALGRSKKEAGENIRFSFGKTTTSEELDQTVQILREILKS